MRGVKCVLLVVAITVAALVPAPGQTPPNGRPPPVVTRSQPITPLGWWVMGSVAAASPIIGTVILGRELTIGEVYHTTLGCMLGPVGWPLADALFPPTVTHSNTQLSTLQHEFGRVGPRRHFSIPPPGETRFVRKEVLVEFSGGASAQAREAFARSLQLTQLETHTFTLTGRTIERWRIDGTRTLPDTLRLAARNSNVIAGQPNGVYFAVQTQPTKQDVPDDAPICRAQAAPSRSAPHQRWR